MHLGFPYSIAGTDFPGLQRLPGPAAEAPKLKLPERADIESGLPERDWAGDSAALAVGRDLEHQLGQAEPGQAAHLYVAADKLDLYAQKLGLLSNAMVGQAPRKLDLVIYRAAGGAQRSLALDCLLPLATNERGIVLTSLQLEISVREGTPQGFGKLLEDGKHLSQLALVFVEPMRNRSSIVETSILQGLRGCGHRLKKLELTDFQHVLRSKPLGRLLQAEIGLDSLSLQLTQSRDRLDTQFRLADLLGPGLKGLQLKGLRLEAGHMEGIGLALGASRQLHTLSLQDCMLAGQTEELFCGLTNNRSLLKLVFLRNLVQASQVPPERLLRLLANLAQLRELEINSFDSTGFRRAMTLLTQESQDLAVTQRQWLVGTQLDLAPRVSWLPLQDELNKLAQPLPASPRMDEDSSDTRSIEVDD